jgi:hypothetical protein
MKRDRCAVPHRPESLYSTGVSTLTEPVFTEHAATGGGISLVALHLVAQQLDAKTDDDYDPRGSAVMLSPSFAITARHIVEPTLLAAGTVGSEGQFHLNAFQMLDVDGGQHAVRFSVVEVGFVDKSDVAVLRLALASDLPPGHEYKSPIVALDPPHVGERTAAFGYYEPSAKRGPGKKVVISRRMATSVGEVIDVYPNRRDSHNFPGPCFATNARYEGSMSGGPVFNDAGHLVGIVGACMKGYEGAPDYSVVSLLVPMLSAEMTTLLPGDEAPRKRTMLELARSGMLGDIRGADRIEVFTAPDGLTGLRLRRA